jgi:HEPN domain-containing protein
MKPEDENWLDFAADDLKMAQLALEEKLFNQVCFHAEQCVEKTLKAIYVRQEKAYPRTHKLADLLSHLPPKEFKDLHEQIIDLDRFYIPTRYPDALPGSLADSLPSENDAREALETAEIVFKRARNKQI